jgi:hypothetical protein
MSSRGMSVVEQVIEAFRARYPASSDPICTLAWVRLAVDRSIGAWNVGNSLI